MNLGAARDRGIPPPKQINRAGENMLSFAFAECADVGDQQFAGFQIEAGSRSFSRGFSASQRSIRATSIQPGVSQ